MKRVHTFFRTNHISLLLPPPPPLLLPFSPCVFFVISFIPLLRPSFSSFLPSCMSQANRGFVSKWAEKLLKTSKKWFSAPDQPTVSSSAHNPAPAAAAAAAAAPSLPPGGGGSGLIDATAASRAAALGQTEVGPGGDGAKAGAGMGGGGGGVVDPADRDHSYDADDVLALSELLAVLLRRWGTGANASNQVMQVSYYWLAKSVFSFSSYILSLLLGWVRGTERWVTDGSVSLLERWAAFFPKSPTSPANVDAVAGALALVGADRREGRT